MKKNIRHIVMSCILALVVTDYIWIEFLQDVWVVVELSQEDENIQKIKEGEKKESKPDHEPEKFHSGSRLNIELFSSEHKKGSSFTASLKGNTPKFYILNRQIKIPS